MSLLLEAKPQRRLSRPEQSVRSVYAKHKALSLTEQRLASKELQKILNKYLRDIDRILSSALKGGPPYGPAVRLIVDSRIKVLTNQFAGNMVNYMQTSTISAVELLQLREAEVALKTYAKNLPKELQKVLANPFPKGKLAQTVLNILEDTALGTRVGLSGNLWRLNTYTNSRVSLVIRKGLEKGLHPFEVSKILERELVPAGKIGPVWERTSAPRRLGNLVGKAPPGFVTRVGTVAFNYQRLVRTEMFMAQRAAHLIRVAQMNSLPKRINPVKGVRWNLSGAHPRQDICDEWASADRDGLGPGVYKVQNVPMGHPQEMCTTSTSMVGPIQYDKQMRNFLNDENMSAREMAELLQVRGGEYINPAMERVLGNAVLAGEFDGLNAVNEGMRFGFG